MSTNTDGRAEISKVLANVAGILLAGALTFSLFAIEKVEPTGLFWGAVLLCVTAIVLSIFACGKGMDLDSSGWYNLQALSMVLGLCLFIALLPLSSSMRKGDDAAAEIGELSNQLVEYRAQVSALEARVDRLIADRNFSSESDSDRSRAKEVRALQCREKARPCRRTRCASC